MGGGMKFLVYLVIFTILAYLLAYVFLWISPQYLHSKVLLLMPAFYFVVLVGSRLILRAAIKNDDKRFSQFFLAITVFRFLLYLAMLLAYSFSFREDAVRFIISFFTFYIYFTVIEVFYIYRELHPSKS